MDNIHYVETDPISGPLLFPISPCSDPCGFRHQHHPFVLVGTSDEHRCLCGLPGRFRFPADTTVTAVKLYLLSSFQGGQGSSVGFRIVFEPSTLLTDWTHGPTQVCDIRNDGIGGTTMVSNTCGIYSGDPNAPGTFTMSADHAFTALAASGFSIKVQRGDLGGTAESVWPPPWWSTPTPLYRRCRNSRSASCLRQGC